MKGILLGAAAFFVTCGTAMADDLYANFYGNTVTIAAGDGGKTMTYVNQDMSWEQHRADGTVVKGTYAWKDATTACFTQTSPAPASPTQATVCLPNQMSHNVGDSWSVNDGAGKPVTITLTAGR
jgi:hypothetical protein